MLYNYENNFNVLEKFENNDFQNILMGVDKFNPDDIVVINIFKKSLMINSILADKFRNKLSSLVMLEETDDELIVITKYHEGMPLKNYLDNYDTTLKHRINFAYEFLKKISIYDSFDDFFKRLFIDEDQIIMKDDELLMNELLVMDNQMEIGTATFQEVCQKIGTILNHIISAADDESAKESIQEFIHNLKNNTHTYTNLDQVHEAFKKIYLYDMFLDEDQENTLLQDSSPTQDTSSKNVVAAVGGTVLGAHIGNELLNKDLKSNDEDWESNLKSAFGRKEKEEVLMDPPINQKIAETPPLEQEHLSLSKEDTAPIDTPAKDIVSDQKNELNDTSDSDAPIHFEKPTSMDGASETVLADSPHSDDLESDEILSQEEEDQLQALFMQNNTDLTENHVEEKKKNNKGLIWLLLLLLLISGVWGISTLRNNSNLSKSQPIVHIVKTRIGDNYFFENKTEAGDSAVVKTEWKIFYEGELLDIQDSYDYTVTLDKEGSYEVQLRVMNDKNVWSEWEKHEFIHVPISNENGTDGIITPEKMDNYTVPMDETQITKDDHIFRNGTYSYKMNFDEPGQKTFTIKDTFLDDKAIISLWLRSSDTNEMTLTFKGYNNNVEVFSRVMKHTPILANQWEMKQFTVEVSKLVDSIEVTISDKSGQVWIDDFSINSYK